VRLDETHRRSSRGQHDHLDDSRPDFSAGFFALMKERALRRSTYGQENHTLETKSFSNHA
jgi:hypothetical protein